MGTLFNVFRTNIFIGNATRQGGWWLFWLFIQSALSGCGRSLDILDSNEQQVFHTTSLRTAMARGRDASHRLILPKEENPPATADTSSPNQLVILLFGDQGIYVYTETGIRAGKKYTYSELQKWLMKKKLTSPGTVLIKPAASSTYKNTVHMLDAMKLAGITRYALVDISPKEEAYVKQIQ